MYAVSTRLASGAVTLVTALALSSVALAASHREAPLIALDPAADITDVYAFRNWEDGKTDKVVFIMNVIPAQEPSSGPNYFFFDENVAYDFNLDTNRNGKADDVIYRVRFKTEIRPPFDDLPVSYAGITPNPPGLPPAITDLDGPNLGGGDAARASRLRGSTGTGVVRCIVGRRNGAVVFEFFGRRSGALSVVGRIHAPALGCFSLVY